MIKFTGVCGQKEEWIFRNKAGRLIHLLPGEEHYGELAGRKAFQFERRHTVVLPVGAAKKTGIKGRKWGGYCQVRCRLVLPYRFIIRHEHELLEDKYPEQILAELMRKTIRDEMEKNASEMTSQPEEYGTMWEQIRGRIHDCLIAEGWTLEELRPGFFHVKGA